MRSKEQQNTYPLTAAKSAEPIDINHFKFQQWLRQIFAYSADGKVATISSSVTNGGSIELAYTTYNQSAVANLLHEGYLKISPDFSAAASDEVDPAADLEFVISLSLFTSDAGVCRFYAAGREIARSSSEQIIGVNGELPNAVVFTVRFASPRDKQVLLDIVSQFGFEVADDLAFTDSLALYLNINYLKHVQAQPAENQQLHWI